MNRLIVRAGGSRALLSFLLKTAVALLLIGLAPLLITWPFGRTHAPQVSVYDEEGILQVAPVVDRLEDLRFRKDVGLVVVTLDVGYSDNFNTAVLTYARENHPEWISASDPNYWADGVVILGVSRHGRWTGTYFGEDVKVDESVQARIQDAGKPDFRTADWAAGIVAMGEEAASAIGRPAALANDHGIIGGMSGALGLVGLGTMWGVAATARSRYRTARTHYTNVTRDWDATEVLARTIPGGEPHGAQLLTRYAWFRGRYYELTSAMNELDSVKGLQWFGKGRLSATKELVQRASELDQLDDAIANASALLTLSSGWQKAWDNEVGPVYEDIASFKRLISDVAKRNVGVDTSEDSTWILTATGRIGLARVELGDGRMTPGEALTMLDEISADVHDRASRLAQRAIDADTSSYAKGRKEQYREAHATWVSSADPYTGSWQHDGLRGTWVPASTIRINPSSAGLGAGVEPVGGSSSSFRPVEGLVVGYSQASSWSPASSSDGGGGGYSGGYSGGGGFSGAGSSSHF